MTIVKTILKIIVSLMLIMAIGLTGIWCYNTFIKEEPVYDGAYFTFDQESGNTIYVRENIEEETIEEEHIEIEHIY